MFKYLWKREYYHNTCNWQWTINTSSLSTKSEIRADLSVASYHPVGNSFYHGCCLLEIRILLAERIMAINKCILQWAQNYYLVFEQQKEGQCCNYVRYKQLISPKKKINGFLDGRWRGRKRVHSMTIRNQEPRVITRRNENYLLTYVRWRNVFFFVTNTTILW